MAFHATLTHTPESSSVLMTSIYDHNIKQKKNKEKIFWTKFQNMISQALTVLRFAEILMRIGYIMTGRISLIFFSCIWLSTKKWIQNVIENVIKIAITWFCHMFLNVDYILTVSYTPYATRFFLCENNKRCTIRHDIEEFAKASVARTIFWTLRDRVFCEMWSFFFW